jgi:hypothetical protein
VLHDINLPLIHPNAPGWGVKYLFDGLNVEKDVSAGSRLPNIGSFEVPEDKESFALQLRCILFAHEWQAVVGNNYLQQLGLTFEQANSNAGE